MTSQLENELKAALTQRANEVPDTASRRFQGQNYHPRSRSPKFRVAIGGASAAVLATAASVVLLTVGPGVENAFASWTPSPTTPASGQVAAAESTCLAAIVTLAQNGNTANNSTSFITGSSAWRVEVADVRGPFTLVAYQATNGTNTDSASCLSGGSTWSAGPQVTLSNGAGAGISGNANSSAGPAQGYSSTSISNALPSTWTVGGVATSWNSASNDSLATGQTGSGVTGVVLNLSDGTSVTTTVANGYFAAWWPGKVSVTSASVTTAQGTTTDTFPNS